MPKGQPFEAVIVEPGDTLSGIALKVFRNAAAWPQLARINCLVGKECLIQPGDLLIVSGTRPIPQPSPGRVHRYEGDTPWN